jgi:peptide/nickel transport system ATP-binding protein
MTEILRMTNLKIEGFTDEQWVPIVKGVDVTLNKGEVLGLIGESGAGKSTIGLASMAYTRMGCRITGDSIVFDGMELFGQSEEFLRKIRGTRIAYVAQSAAGSFNPAHRLIKQYAEAPVQHGKMNYAEAEKNAVDIYRRLLLPDPERIGYRYPHQVSGGQLQRAMVAWRAPRILSYLTSPPRPWMLPPKSRFWRPLKKSRGNSIRQRFILPMTWRWWPK